MKSSATTAIALTLLMFLLVLAAAVFILFQGQQSLKGDLQDANDNVRTLEKQQAQIELNSSAAQATLDTLELSGTKSASENVGLTEQLANSDQPRKFNSHQILKTPMQPWRPLKHKPPW